VYFGVFIGRKIHELWMDILLVWRHSYNEQVMLKLI